MDLDRKNKTHWLGRLQVLCTMIMNGELNYLKDPSEAMLSRLWYFQFPNRFRGENNEDKGRRDKIKAELPGVLNWAARGLGRLIRNNWRLTSNPGSEQLREQFRIVSAPVAAWCDENLVVKPDDKSRFVSGDVMRAAFDTWRTQHGLKEISVQEFNSQFRLKYPFAKYKQSGQTGPYGYRGFTMKT